MDAHYELCPDDGVRNMRFTQGTSSPVGAGAYQLYEKSIPRIPADFRLGRPRCCAASEVRRGIASLEMILNSEPLPNLFCSPASTTNGGNGEAAEHGDAERTDGVGGGVVGD